MTADAAYFSRQRDGYAAYLRVNPTYVNPAIVDAASRIVSKERIEFPEAMKRAEAQYAEAYAREECANGRENEYLESK